MRLLGQIDLPLIREKFDTIPQDIFTEGRIAQIPPEKIAKGLWGVIATSHRLFCQFHRQRGFPDSPHSQNDDKTTGGYGGGLDIQRHSSLGYNQTAGARRDPEGQAGLKRVANPPRLSRGGFGIETR